MPMLLKTNALILSNYGSGNNHTLLIVHTASEWNCLIFGPRLKNYVCTVSCSMVNFENPDWWKKHSVNLGSSLLSDYTIYTYE